MLGFFLGFGSGGLTKAAGDAGADTCTSGSSEPSFNARPFAFRGFRGEGEVMGRSKESRSIGLSDMVRSSRECIPKPFEEKEERGRMMTGDSGDELGDGSVRADESAVEIVVVGDESVDSEACVDVLSRCLCCSSGSGAGLAVALLLSSSRGDGDGDAAAAATSDCCGESTKALWSMLGALQLWTDMKEGSWLWYACGPAATGMLGKQLLATGAGVSNGAYVMRPGCAWGVRQARGKANVDKTKQGVLRV